MLQYVESSVASHLMVVPKNPKMPDPKIPPPPPPLRKLPFAIIMCDVCGYTIPRETKCHPKT